MLALANSVCLLASLRSGRHVLSLLLCAGLIASCCVVCCSRCSTTTRSYIQRKTPSEAKVWENNTLLLKKNENR